MNLLLSTLQRSQSLRKRKDVININFALRKVGVCILHVQLAVRVTHSLISMKLRLRFKNENNNGFIRLVFITQIN